MNSNNLDEKLLLAFAIDSFKHWGIQCVTEETLKKAKKNDPSVSRSMANLLFDLCILHMFSYRWKPEQLTIRFHSQQQMQNIIIAHLSELGCPLLTCIKDSIGLDFSQTRLILLVSGWVMAVSCYFDQIVPKMLQPALKDIYKPNQISLPKHVTSSSSQYQTSSTSIRSKSDRICQLMKHLSTHKYQLECLQHKLAKMTADLDKGLAAANSQLRAKDLFSSCRHPQDIEEREQQLKRVIESETDGAKLHNYFWIWLDQKIIAAEYEHLKGCYDQFERMEADLPASSIEVDLSYVHRFVAKCSDYEERMTAIENKLSKLPACNKKYKDIGAEVNFELQYMRREGDAPNPKQSFIGMQMQSFMSIHQTNNAVQNTKIDKQVDRSRPVRKDLRKQLKHYLKTVKEAIILL